MEIWTIVEQTEDSSVYPWMGVYATMGGATRDIKKELDKVFQGESYLVSPWELETTGEFGEIWIAEYGNNTYWLTMHRKEG